MEIWNKMWVGVFFLNTVYNLQIKIMWTAEDIRHTEKKGMVYGTWKALHQENSKGLFGETYVV